MLACAVLGGIVAAHLGLVNRGAWEPDEYSFIAGFRDEGVAFFWDRFLSVSPRPLSELFLMAYAWVVLAVRLPLIVPALLLLWAGFFAAALPGFAGWRRSAGTLGVLAFMLLGQGAFEVFYWPVGAAAYLPVLSAALFLVMSRANEHWRGRAAVTALVLIAAAWSAEAGALLVLFYFCTATIARAPPFPRIYWLGPVAAAVLVVLLTVTNQRLSTATGLANGDRTLIHHWGASLARAAVRGGAEFLSSDAESFDRRHLLLGLLIKLLFFSGVYLCWMTGDPEARSRRRGLWPVAAALAATGFATIAANYWSNGTDCCQRHNLLRQDLGFLVLAAIAMGLPPLLRKARPMGALMGPLLLTGGALLALAPRAADLVQDYRYFLEPSRARALSWASGFSSGPNMTLYQPVPDQLFSLAMPPGVWRMGDTWWIDGVLRFFGKQQATVVLEGAHVRGDDFLDR